MKTHAERQSQYGRILSDGTRFGVVTRHPSGEGIEIYTYDAAGHLDITTNESPWHMAVISSAPVMPEGISFDDVIRQSRDDYAQEIRPTYPTRDYAYALPSCIVRDGVARIVTKDDRYGLLLVEDRVVYAVDSLGYAEYDDDLMSWTDALSAHALPDLPNGTSWYDVLSDVDSYLRTVKELKGSFALTQPFGFGSPFDYFMFFYTMMRELTLATVDPDPFYFPRRVIVCGRTGVCLRDRVEFDDGLSVLPLEIFTSREKVTYVA